VITPVPEGDGARPFDGVGGGRRRKRIGDAMFYDEL